jgi:hypothetical protein
MTPNSPEMITAKTFYRKWPYPLLSVCVLTLAAASLGCEHKRAAQTSPPPPPPATVQHARERENSSGQDKSAAGNESSKASAQPGQTPSAGETASGAERQISPQEAEELFRSVDEILQFASKDTDLPIRRQVKRRLTSRDEVVAYIEKHMREDEDAQRLRRSELVLKKFGLLPRDFDLQTFLVALLREQVAGYYDPKTKTVNLLNWIDPEQQKPVLAHELTHALQDQSFGLEKWMKAGMTDLEKTKQPTPADIENDEASAARQAVVEGQAMAVLVDYMLAPTGQSLLNSPQMVEALKAGMLVGTADSVQFRNAPIYLKEALTFPYRYGIDFVAEVLTKRGKEQAFAGAFATPPRSTRQIMEPETYLSSEHLEPMRLPNFEHDFNHYERFDIGAIGEFDVAVLIDQYEGTDVSKNLYPHWRGGYYYAARPKGDGSAPLALLYVSRWSNAQRAAEFAAVYAQSLPKRYKRAHETGSDQTHNFSFETLTGEHAWLTEEGPVVIDVVGDTVLVTESLDQDTTQKLEHEVFAEVAETAKWSDPRIWQAIDWR